MKRKDNDPDALEEYDFSNGVRGKHAQRYAEGTNVVLLDPDVAEYFHNDHEIINATLRKFIKVKSCEPCSGREIVILGKPVKLKAKKENPADAV